MPPVGGMMGLYHPRPPGEMIMAKTEVKSYRWTSGSGARSAYQSVHELLRIDAPEGDVAALFAALVKIRGAHRVEIRRSGIDSDHRSVTFRGTDRAQRGAANVIMLSGIREVD